MGWPLGGSDFYDLFNAKSGAVEDPETLSNFSREKKI
jgi:hypothetical protein